MKGSLLECDRQSTYSFFNQLFFFPYLGMYI